MSFLFTLPQESRQILDSVPALINKTFPVPGRFRGALPSQVAELSRLLTGGRGDRRLSYLSRPEFLSAYLRYFLPWNIYRLCLLLPGLDISLNAGDTVVDIGSGPLTFVCALWIARPDLRSLPLEFCCIDRCAPALEAGKKFFTAISGNSEWKIHLVREDIDIRKAGIMRNKKQAALVCAVNIFNEVYERLPHSDTEGLRRMSADIAGIMHNCALDNADILTVEPGVPQSGHFITFLRSAFMDLGRMPLSPCPHTGACALPGAKKRWCHFAFDAEDAPKDLQRLSAAAGIPKERLVLSFLLTGPVVNKLRPLPAKKTANAAKKEQKDVRIISDAFPLPDNRFGRYGCSSAGLVLLAGEKNRIFKLACGSLFNAAFTANKRDAKSGAIIIEV